jgi:hypothetical protein
MGKLTDKQLWDALDKITLEAEIEDVLAMTPEQIRGELVAQGHDIAELNAKADAFFASLQERLKNEKRGKP